MDTPRTAEDVAKEYQAKKAEAAKAAETEKKPAEASEAATGSSPETQKTTEPEKKQDAVEKAEKEESKRILDAKDEDLNDEDKAKKVELQKVKDTEEAEAKKVQEKSNVEKRIGQLTGELKDLRRDKDAHKEHIQRLEDELAAVKGQVNAKPADEVEKVLDKQAEERVTKYLDEDMDKPREQRREMTHEALEEWLLEDVVRANEWMMKRLLRNERESEADREALNKPDPETKDREETEAKVREVLKQQDASQQRLIKAHPEMDITKRLAELKDSGKTPEEAFNALEAEIPKYKIAREALRAMSKEDREAWNFDPDGPEKIGKLIDERLAEEAKSKSKETAAERDKRIADEAAENERQRQEQVDAGTHTTRKTAPAVKPSGLYEQQLAIARKANISKERLDKTLARRKRIPGAG